MKFLVALTAFLFVLGFNLKSVAEDKKDPPVSCSKETSADTNCAADSHGQAGHDSHSGKGHGSNYDWSHKRHEQISAIFPEKKQRDGANATPKKVSLVAPKFLSKVSADAVTLEWKASEGAKAYHVQVSKDAGFNNRSMYVAEEKNLTDTKFEVKGLEAGVKYFWRVSALNDEQESMYTKSPFASSSFETK
jgi:hypothetical protein